MNPFEIILIIALVIISSLAIYGKMASRKKYSEMASEYEIELRQYRKEHFRLVEEIAKLHRECTDKAEAIRRLQRVINNSVKPIDNKV